jgi:hypothetical protein
MSFELWPILLKNKKLQQLLDTGVTQIIEGFTREDPTPEEAIAVLQGVLEKMRSDTFPDTYPSKEDYFELLLSLVSQAAFLKERPLALTDFYVSNYHFYFPRPSKMPEVETAKLNRLVLRSGRRIIEPPDTPYFFFAVSASAAGVKLASAISSSKGLTQPNDWRTALATSLGVSADVIIAIQGIGRDAKSGNLIFVAAQGVMDELDLAIETGTDTRANLINELQAFLKKSSF